MSITDYPDEDRRAEAQFLRECATRMDAAEREDPGRGYARRAEIKRLLAAEVEPDG
jgi:hypothetical protein